jgi:hypothetical protein
MRGRWDPSLWRSTQLKQDYCFECEAFPCELEGFGPELKAKWLRANERLAEVGVEAYWMEVKNRSHYA